MILIALGANLPGPLGKPEMTLRQIPEFLDQCGIRPVGLSAIYETAPIGPRGQGSYFNAVIAVRTRLLPLPLLAALQSVEEQAGRRRSRRWGARTLDLDLIAYDEVVLGWKGRCLQEADVPQPVRRGSLVLPHLSLHLRPFVVLPICDFAPLWHHPVTGETAFGMARYLKGQVSGQLLRRAGGWNKV